MIVLKNAINVLLMFLLFSINKNTSASTKENQLVIMKYLLQSGNYIPSNRENRDTDQDEPSDQQKIDRISDIDDDDNDTEENEEYNDDEIMKTSEQIAFRPLFRRYVPAVIFRHRQMIEEKKRRKQERRESSERKTSASNVYNRYSGDNVYICYGQNCRPITAYDIRQFQLLQPTTRIYQQRTDPGKYFNEYAFIRNG